MTKSRETVFDEAIASDRRTFIQGVGVAVLTVQCLPLMAHAAGNSPVAGTDGEGNLVIPSGPGLLQHAHELLIPYAVLKAPPAQGVHLTSTKALFHQHEFVFTQKELSLVSQGGTISRKASSHVFVIALAKR